MKVKPGLDHVLIKVVEESIEEEGGIKLPKPKKHIKKIDVETGKHVMLPDELDPKETCSFKDEQGTQHYIVPKEVVLGTVND